MPTQVRRPAVRPAAEGASSPPCSHMQQCPARLCHCSTLSKHLAPLHAGTRAQHHLHAPMPLTRQPGQECNDHIGRMVEHLAARGAQEPTLFLGQVAALWADHTQAMLTLRSIFLFLDRTYVVPHAAARSLFDLGLQLLRSHLDQHPQVPGTVCLPTAGQGRSSCWTLGWAVLQSLCG